MMAYFNILFNKKVLYILIILTLILIGSLLGYIAAKGAPSGPDNTPPFIMRDFPSEITANSALISWTTNEPSDSTVEYCTGPEHCGVFGVNSDPTTDHKIRITGMSAETRYYYWVYSRDLSGNQAMRGYRSFDTPAINSSLINFGMAIKPVLSTPKPSPVITNTPPVSKPGYFQQDMTIEEAGSMSESSNRDWWVNSGAYLTVDNGVARTVLGQLPADDKWYRMYTESNPGDTDEGVHPQNLFRLVTRSDWKEPVQEGYFNINKYWQSSSPNRDGHNGILLMSRYVDGNNLYYAGIRVDGRAIIKKKLKGKYFTMASEQVFPGKFDRDTNPNLIPENVWIGLKSELRDNMDGTVTVRLSVNMDGEWEQVAEAKDDGLKYGPVIKEKAHAGIRTDFMDAYIWRYKISERK